MIERELRDALAERQQEGGLSAVDHIAGRDLLLALAEERGGGVIGRGAEDAENRGDRHIAVDVRRAVERVAGDREFARRIEGQDRLFLFGSVIGGRRLAQGVDDQAVGDDVELALLVAVGASAADFRAERAAQGAAGDDLRKRDARAGQTGDGLGETLAPFARGGPGLEIRIKALAPGGSRRRLGISSWASSAPAVVHRLRGLFTTL